ncbi:thioesterase II family protein [Nocardiopsis valliformis]|uniref:thioesterase II family protein n=1 Tax=Nocardiopsis valliformis TaxID=239974 RepID=UPI00034B2F2C|nr:alpha/beta fold hydrolase [Nocardiopsis valliformis]
MREYDTGRAAWFDQRFRSRNARQSLYCLPFAGGTANFYADWAGRLGGSVELVPVQLPARGPRMTEPPVPDIGTAADEIASAIRAEPTAPLLFGHSMGAILAFEVARRLQGTGEPPGFLFVSGRPSPRLIRPRRRVSDLSRSDFLRMLRDYGAADEEILGNDELVDLLLPMMRSDFSLIERYRYRPGAPLSCPILAWCGDEDPEVAPEEMTGWGKETSADFEQFTLSGDHFFLREHSDEITGAVRRAAARVANAGGTP